MGHVEEAERGLLLTAIALSVSDLQIENELSNNTGARLNCSSAASHALSPKKGRGCPINQDFPICMKSLPTRSSSLCGKTRDVDFPTKQTRFLGRRFVGKLFLSWISL
ncbi:hypothetical protein SLE2022_114140 [Rubroshorea leprosula]